MQCGRNLWGLVFAGLLLSGCGGGENSDPAGPTRIVTTTAMITDIVRTVAGERAEVVGLIGQGVDPHLYKPTRNDVRLLDGADIVFYNGLFLEGRMDAVFRDLADAGKPVFAVTDGLERESLRHPPESDAHADPHVWMDVAAWRTCVEYVAERLSSQLPEHADEFRRNASRLQEELRELDAYVRDSVASIPETSRVLVTAHDAFGYFGRAYDIEIRSVQGISTESEAGIRDINELVDFLVERKIQAVFAESSVTSDHLQAVIEGAASRGWTVRIGGELFSDAMGSAETYEGTYIGMLDHNATRITRALGGQAPERGWRGRLSQSADQP
jgi:manganese/zinc/iron transport system substrate-binding protein